MSRNQADFCIVGAGPAGSALAIRLAQLGHDVCVIERARFPRTHIGESLSPGIWPQLELLGIAGAVAAAGFWPCRSALIRWETASVVRRDFATSAGLLVDRGRFDALLIEHARACGARVLQPAVLRARTRHDRGWRLGIESAEGMSTLDVTLLADASGRSAVLRGRKARARTRTLALYGYWRGGRLPGEPRVEAGADAWYWGVPLPDGTYNAIAFVDTESFRSRRARSLEAAYRALIGRSGLMARCHDVHLSGPVRAADATPYVDRDSVGPHSIKLGEAALALDPLSSSGVQNAFNTALVGAVVVNTLLRAPPQAAAAMRFYTTNLAESFDRHHGWAAQHYAAAAAVQSGPFWTARAAGSPAATAPSAQPPDQTRSLRPDLPIRLSPHATFAEEPCIVGDLVAMTAALRHPELERPVAFLGGMQLSGLLQPVRTGMTLAALMDTWPVASRAKLAIADWLLSHHVLEAQQQRLP